MAPKSTQRREDFQKIVREALTKAEAYHARHRPWDTRLLVLSIVCGALATLLAGGTVAGGPNAAKEWFGGWQVLCSLVALFSATGTVAGALHKSLQITHRVSQAEKCIARLRALEATLAAAEVPLEKALDTFQKISEDHAVCLA